MKTLLKIFVFCAILAGIGAAAYIPAADYWRKRHQPKWRLVEVKQGRIVSVVNSTGNVKPVLSVSVGAFVSGPVKELSAGFNQEVKEGDLLAKIDPRIYDAAVAQNEANVAMSHATLNNRLADVERAEALLHEAMNNEKRALDLRAEDETFVAEQEMDGLKFNRLALEAQVKVCKAAVEQAEAAVKQAEATLDHSRTQLDYTNIKSPVDGIVINRKIDPGQTLASQFQTPELFIVAPDMRKKMHIHAAVDEADIGLIREAQKRRKKVVFTVDAYLDDLFEGEIEEVRYSSTTTQNVVTYPVIVAATNPDLKLLPGMTASISFQVDERKDVVKIPNAALRFYPNLEHVRLADRKLLEGSDAPGATGETEESDQPEQTLSAEERAELRRRRSRRHVWMVEGEFLKAVEVVTGISDSQYTEMISGDLKKGQKLVTGIQPQS